MFYYNNKKYLIKKLGVKMLVYVQKDENYKMCRKK